MENLATAIAFEAVYQAQRSNPGSRADFVRFLRSWAYRVKSNAALRRAFMRDAEAGCYNAFFR